MAAEPFPTKFADPVKSYDSHIYFFQDNPASSDSARALREEIIKEFPHLEVYKFWEKPIGPHSTGMFEVDMRTPAQFAEFVPWIQVHHGVHSVLIHPHTGDDFGDHTHRALWLGDKVPLITSILKKGEVPA